MDISKIIAFAIFWIAVGMLLMLFFSYHIVGVFVALILILLSFWISHCN